MGMYGRVLWFCVVLLGSQSFVSAQDNKTQAWLMVSFEEVNTASPVVAHATFPVKLAGAVTKALPDKLKQEAKEDGFDIEAIVTAVSAMPKDETFFMKKDNFHLSIIKEERPLTQNTASYMLVKNKYLNLPVPLSFTNAAVSLLQFTYKELKGKEQELTQAINALKEMPPGMVFNGKDELINEWMSISLR